jgi:formylglycine-generating enzyme required for sulfatase activity
LIGGGDFASIAGKTPASLLLREDKAMTPVIVTPPRRGLASRTVLIVTAVLVLAVGAVVSLVVARRDPGDGREPDGAPGRQSVAPPDPSSDPGRQEARADGDPQARNSVGMKLRRIPAGTFLMGSPDDEPERLADEQQHEVEITKDLSLGAHEVTQEQFREVMGYNPSVFSAFTNYGQGRPGTQYSYSKPAAGQKYVTGYDTDAFPVENVSWEEAVEFCRRLSALPMERKAGRTYRLPTEAEWEHACRAGGGPRPFYFGHTISPRQANFDATFPYDGAPRGTSLRRTCKVGSYAANRFGLHDMHGNVREWCADWYDADYYGKSPRRDPQGPSGGSLRVIRGGGHSSAGQACRSAVRFSGAPGLRDPDLGFRVVAGIGAR